MRIALLAVFLAGMAALSGCSSSDSPPVSPPGSGDDPGMATDPRAGANLTATRVLDEAIEFQLNDPMPPLAFTVPANGSLLVARYEVRSEGACEAVVGEPDATAAEGAWMEFTSPSGAATRIGPLGGQVCQAVQPRPVFAGLVELAHEPGGWGVTFGGRGIGAWLDLVVEAS